MIRFLLGLVIGIALVFIYQYVVLAPRQPAADRPSEGYDLEIRLTESYLTDSVQQALTDTPLASQVQHARVEVLPAARLRLLAEATVSGVTAPVAADVQAMAVEGALRTDVLGVELGGVRVPPAIAASLEATLNERIQAQFGNSPYRVVGVATEGHELALRLQR